MSIKARKRVNAACRTGATATQQWGRTKPRRRRIFRAMEMASMYAPILALGLGPQPARQDAPAGEGDK